MKCNANTNKSSQATQAYHAPRVLHARPRTIQNGPLETHHTEMTDYDAQNNQSNRCPYLSMHPHLRKSLPDIHPDHKPTLWERSKHAARNFLQKRKSFKQRKDLRKSSKADNDRTIPEHDPMGPVVEPRGKHAWFICTVCRQPTRKHAVENGNLRPSPDEPMCDGCAGELLAEREL